MGGQRLSGCRLADQSQGGFQLTRIFFEALAIQGITLYQMIAWSARRPLSKPDRATRVHPLIELRLEVIARLSLTLLRGAQLPRLLLLTLLQRLLLSLKLACPLLIRCQRIASQRGIQPQKVGEAAIVLCVACARCNQFLLQLDLLAELLDAGTTALR